MSDAHRSPPSVVGFGVFEADLRSGELRKAGVRIPLQEQPLRVLTCLLQNPGELVTRDELRRELWPDNTFLDFEHGLNAAMKRLRDALGDSADTPRFIETLPRRGYRFIAPVQVPGGAPAPVSTPDPETVAPVAAPRSVWPVAAILLSVLAAIAAAAWWRGALPGVPTAPPPDTVTSAAGSTPTDVNPRTVAVATFDNRSVDPALDPLGAQIAGRLIRVITTSFCSRSCRTARVRQ
jgi:DNA-binding winged helix-turn-helix (wHTH) protein